VFTLPLSSLSYYSALYTIYLTWYQRHLSCGLQYSGTPASSSALHPAAALFRPTAPSMRYSRSSFGAPSNGRPSPANRAANSSGNFCPSLSRRHRHPLGQKNHQKWCLSPGSVDLCNLSLFRRCTRTTLLTKRQIRRSESRSEEITAVQASTRLHAPQKDLPFANALHALPRASLVIHALPRAGTVFPRAGTLR
jgi:hypothetical protein